MNALVGRQPAFPRVFFTKPWLVVILLRVEMMVARWVSFVSKSTLYPALEKAILRKP